MFKSKLVKQLMGTSAINRMLLMHHVNYKQRSIGIDVHKSHIGACKDVIKRDIYLPFKGDDLRKKRKELLSIIISNKPSVEADLQVFFKDLETHESYKLENVLITRRKIY